MINSNELIHAFNQPNEVIVRQKKSRKNDYIVDIYKNLKSETIATILDN